MEANSFRWQLASDKRGHKDKDDLKVLEWLQIKKIIIIIIMINIMIILIAITIIVKIK